MARSLAAAALLLFAEVASAATCVNRFVTRRESAGRWVITLLTGRLTFQEAQVLAKEIDAKRSPPIEWVDAKGNAIATQLGTLRVMRPMPVACAGKPSGVIVVVTFIAVKPPLDKMLVKFDASTTVGFEEQKE